MTLIKDSLNQQDITRQTLERLARCFMEKEFPPNTLILKEGEQIASIYIIKEGNCSVYSDRNPLKSKLSTKKGHHYVKMNNGKSEICMGLNQGNMSESFTYFPISTVSKN